jgi:hypothetical protein
VTIAVCLKVQDGLVLAADSAATLVAPGGVSNIYDNANKVVNLRKGLPIGIVFWGAGGLGNSSMTTLAKDLRLRLSDSNDPAWHLDPAAYTIEATAKKAAQFLREEHYEPAFGTLTGDKPSLGFLVAGYSAGEQLAEGWETQVDPTGKWGEPVATIPLDDFGMSWRGETEWITRIALGFGSQLPGVLVGAMGLPPEDCGPAMDVVKSATEVALLHPAMPIQDTVDLASFLVDTTKAVMRFLPGAPTVGGPTEIATITKHEGFKWVARKHYFDPCLNPPGETP